MLSDTIRTIDTVTAEDAEKLITKLASQRDLPKLPKDTPVSGQFRLPLGRLRIWRNHRKTINWENVAEYAETMVEGRQYGVGQGTGIIKPFKIRWDKADIVNGRVKSTALANITGGQQRYYAAYLSGLTDKDFVEVSIEDLSDIQERVVAIWDNVLGTNVDPVELGRELQAIQNQENLSVDALARMLRKPKTWVQDHIDLVGIKHKELLTLIDDSNDGFQLISRIDRVEDDELRALFVAMRQSGVSVPTISALQVIKSAPDNLRAALRKWLEAQWLGFIDRKEKMTVDLITTPLRNESRAHGYILEKGNKNYEWFPIQQENPPVLNAAGEITGHSTSDYVAPGTPTEPPASPTPGEEVPAAPNGNHSPTLPTAPEPPKTHVLPPGDVELALASILRQMQVLTDQLSPVTTIPQPKKVRDHGRKINAMAAELRDMIETRTKT